MLDEWTGPFGGLPPWDKIDPQNFEKHFDTAIAAALDEVEQIAANPAAPTFDNTLVALEKSGSALDRMYTYFRIHCANLCTGEMPSIELKVKPKIIAYFDQLLQDDRLYRRIATLHDNMEALAPDQQELVNRRYKRYRRAGAHLSAEKKARLSQLNQELSALQTTFAQNVLKDQAELIWLTDETELSGLSQELRAALKHHATSAGEPDRWAVKISRSLVETILQSADSRDLRERLWAKYSQRGGNPGARDNNALIPEIITRRQAQAELLGFDSYAHYQLDDRMAKTPQIALDFLMEIWPKAVAKAHKDLSELEAFARQSIPNIELQPWDVPYYTEKMRAETFAYDEQQLRSYFQLPNVVAALHMVAAENFDMRFERDESIPVFHPDVTAYTIHRISTGEPVGLWYLDPFARDGKKGGAWNTTYRVQENIDAQVLPIYSNNANIMKPADSQHTPLLRWREARTFFHEFGHALHGLCSNVRYPSQAGTSVTRDFVEFPSQLLEAWLNTDAVLKQHARHVESNSLIPDDLLERVRAASDFNASIGLVEYMINAIIDLKLHLLPSLDIPVQDYEAAVLAELGMPKQLAMRYRLAHFQHIFSSGYAAGYYSYKWADALTADAAEYFEAQPDGYYDKALAQKLEQTVLSVGGTIPPEKAYENFRGRPLDGTALMRKLGLV